MGEKDRKLLEARLKNTILPALVKEGKFKGSNENTRVIDVRIVSPESPDDGNSCASFVEVHFENKDHSKTVEKLLIKYPSANKKYRQLLKADEKFENECAVYRLIIPKYLEFLKEQSRKLDVTDLVELIERLFPPCYYAEFDSNAPENAMIILKDLRESGYVEAKHGKNMDWEHIKLAIEQLAAFHGISYAYKLEKTEEFDELMVRWKSTGYGEENEKEKHETLNDATRHSILRLLEDPVEDIDLEVLKKLDVIFKDTLNVLLYLLTPDESSVLCHGNFSSSNLLYRYDRFGRPEQVMLIDFQTPYHSSPAIDLSSFLFGCTDRYFRNHHFNEILKLYHSKQIATVSKILGRQLDEPQFSSQSFRQDFSKHAVFGYVMYSLFFLAMIGDYKEPKNTTLPSKSRRLQRQASEANTIALIDVFTEFYERGFFEDLTQNYSIDTHL